MMEFGSPALYESLLGGVSFSPMIPYSQDLRDNCLRDVSSVLTASVREKKLLRKILPKQRVAIAVGSRELCNMVELVRTIVELVKSIGAYPFIVPAMGSHGGATATGQREVLEHLGITDESMGVPILSSMETVCVGSTSDGLAVHMDRNAFEADHVIPLNRIKPHTDFRGSYESGLMKMLAIGLGKQHGADICHSLGFPAMSENVLNFGKVILQTGKIAFFVGSVENEFHHVLHLEALGTDEVLKREPILLELAREHIPRLPFDKVDLIVVNRMGKDLSGTGMDTNVIGRSGPLGTFRPFAERVAVFSLTEKTAGNANGMGLADIGSKRLADQIDFAKTYPNGITSNEPFPMRMPVILPNDRLAYLYGIKACVGMLPSPIRIVHIEDTLSVHNFFISQALCPEYSGATYLPGFDGEGRFTEHIRS